MILGPFRPRLVLGGGRGTREETQGFSLGCDPGAFQAAPGMGGGRGTREETQGFSLGCDPGAFQAAPGMGGGRGTWEGTQGFSLGCDPAALRAAFPGRPFETQRAAWAVAFSEKCRFPSTILIDLRSIILITLRDFLHIARYKTLPKSG